MTSKKRRYVTNKRIDEPQRPNWHGHRRYSVYPTDLTHHPTAASPNWPATLAYCARSSNSNMFICSLSLSLRILCAHSYSLQCLKFFNHCLVFFPMIVLNANFKYFLSSMRFYPFCFSFLWYCCCTRIFIYNSCTMRFLGFFMLKSWWFMACRLI